MAWHEFRLTEEQENEDLDLAAEASEAIKAVMDEFQLELEGDDARRLLDALDEVMCEQTAKLNEMHNRWRSEFKERQESLGVDTDRFVLSRNER